MRSFERFNIFALTGLMVSLLVASSPASSAQTSRGSVDEILPSEKREKLLRAIENAPVVDNEKRDVVWATVDGEDIALDVFWPNGPGPHPMVVWIHGGGFRGGFKELGEYACRTFAANGYVAFTTNYRLAPEHKFPTAANDCLGAIVWAKKHAAEFNGNPDRIAVAGESAGGNLAALAAWAADDDRFEPTGTGPDSPSPSVNAVIPVYGVFDFAALSDERRASLTEQYLGSQDLLDAASPVTYLTAESVPTLLVVGDADRLYPQSQAVKSRLEKLGTPHDMLVADRADHAFIIGEWDEFNSQLAHKAMVAFLNEHLKSPAPLRTIAFGGTWLPETAPQLCGTLQCKARLVSTGKWEATFRGFCNEQFLYEVKMDGVERDGQVIFSGETDLGGVDGLYTWTGSIADGAFNGTWFSQDNPDKKGSFTMEQQDDVTVPKR